MLEEFIALYICSISIVASMGSLTSRMFVCIFKLVICCPIMYGAEALEHF